MPQRIRTLLTPNGITAQSQQGVVSILIGFFCLSFTENKQDLSLSISTSGPASISMSVEVNGTLYSGECWIFFLD